MKLLEELRDRGEGQDLAQLVARVPYARFLGIEVDRKGHEITTVLPFQPALVGNPLIPALHGGVVGAMLEITSVLQLLFVLECERMPKTIDISIDYLRSARANPTYGRAIVTRQGRRVANVRAEIWQEERSRPVAASHGHFLLAPLGGEPS